MTPKQLLKAYGTQSEIARQFGYTRAAVGLWFKHDRIPYRAQMLIQMTTHGAYKATWEAK